MVEARNLGSKLIVQAFILLGSSAREGRVLSHVVRFSILAFQLPLTSMTASHNLCHHLSTIYDNILVV